MIAIAVAWLALASAPGSLHARLDAMREQVRQNRQLEDEQRSLLEARLVQVDSALSRFERLAASGEERTRQMQPLMVAGTALVADDVSGVGAADDVLLPFVALATLIVHVRTRAPASDLELQAAMNQLEASIDAAAHAGQAVLMAQQVGTQIRSWTSRIARHLARMLGRTVGGEPPDHQRDPEGDRRHWWKELMTLLDSVMKKALTPKQLLRELMKKFTPEQLAEIRQAFREAAKLMKQDPPDFPPVALP